MGEEGAESFVLAQRVVTLLSSGCAAANDGLGVLPRYDDDDDEVEEVGGGGLAAACTGGM